MLKILVQKPARKAKVYQDQLRAFLRLPVFISDKDVLWFEIIVYVPQSVKFFQLMQQLNANLYSSL